MQWSLPRLHSNTPLSTRAGCECIAHALQGLSELDPNTTISKDGIGAFDQISRAAMLDGLMNVAGGSQALPFVRMFYGAHSSYLCEDSFGVTHMIPQGEGGEQGDPLMPLLFCNTARWRLCNKICATASSFSRIWMTRTLPPLHTESEMCTSQWMRICGLYSRIRIHSGKTVECNQRPTRVLRHVGGRSDPEARVWRGSDLPFEKQGIKILGTPLGHPQFVEAHLNKKIEEHEVLLERMPTVPDLQSAWSLLLHCASARANYLLRVVSPAATRGFAHRHNEGLWKCLCEILHVEADRNAETKSAASMPLNLGGMVEGRRGRAG